MAVKLTNEELNNVITRLNGTASNINELILAIDNVMKRLQTSWEGSAQRAYLEAYEQIKIRSLIPVKDLLESYPATLREAKEGLGFKDDENATHIIQTYGAVIPVGN